MAERRIERATTAHLQGLARCHAACWVEAYQGIVPAEYLATMADLRTRMQRWAPRLDRPDSTVCVALAGSEVVGEIWVTSTDGPVALPDVELHSLYVRRSEYGSGLADELIAVALGDAPAWLWVFSVNERARRFYRRHGFVEQGVRQIDPGTGVEELRMVR